MASCGMARFLQRLFAVALAAMTLLTGGAEALGTPSSCQQYALKPANTQPLLKYMNKIYGYDKTKWPFRLKKALTAPFSKSIILVPDEEPAFLDFFAGYDLNALSGKDRVYIKKVLAAHVAFPVTRPRITAGPEDDFDPPLEFTSIAGTKFRIENRYGDLYVVYNKGGREKSVEVSGVPLPYPSEWNAAKACGAAWVIPIWEVIEPDFPKPPEEPGTCSKAGCTCKCVCPNTPS